MGYKEVIDTIKKIENENFTMDSLQNIDRIHNEIESVYISELMNEKIDAKVRYQVVKEQLNNVIFHKLKEKLGFENEIINKIINSISFVDDIQDILVLDGNVIVKVKALDKDKCGEVSYYISDGFFDVSSNDFIKSLNYDVYREYFTNALNNAMVPFFKDKMHKSKLLNINNRKIEYNLDNLNICLNKTLKEIMQINTDVTHKVAKVLIKYNDELYYFDMKIHYAYLELAQNDYPLNSVSEMLSKKEKVKKL